MLITLAPGFRFRLFATSSSFFMSFSTSKRSSFSPENIYFKIEMSNSNNFSIWFKLYYLFYLTGFKVCQISYDYLPCFFQCKITFRSLVWNALFSLYFISSNNSTNLLTRMNVILTKKRSGYNSVKLFCSTN